jgi:signal transduction histidine kinase
VRISLRLRILSLIAVINILVFAAGLLYLSRKIADDRLEERINSQQESIPRVLYTLRGSIDPDRELRVAEILDWPHWGTFTDAIITDLNPRGVSLNPVGCAMRGPEFDRERIERDVAIAVERNLTIESAGGIAMPIVDARGDHWGGCWFRIDYPVDHAALWRELLPWFFATTLLLFLGTFTVLRKYVLQPVSRLTGGARELRDGNQAVQVRAPRHRDELADLIGTFNTMASEVHTFHEHLEEEVENATRKAYQAEAAAMRQRRLAAMGELAAGIAHEINNPLGGLINAVDVLDRENTTQEKRARYHELLRGGLQRIQGTVARLLRLTPRQAELTPVSLDEPVGDAIDLVRHRAEMSGIELLLRSDGAPHIIEGLSSELGQAVLNLLVNSLDALEERGEKGRIEVSLERGDEEVSVRVVDDGPGVDPALLDRVADLFYSTKSVDRGNGLGLALVHSVVDQHGGRVHLLNEPDGGFRVELVFPVSGESGGAS